MRLHKLRVALASILALLGLPAGLALATSPVSSGASIFPLVMVSQPLNNSVDLMNQWLILANNQLVGLSALYAGAATIPTGGVDSSGVVFSTTIQANPLVQQTAQDIMVSTSLTSASMTTILASEVGRSITPGAGLNIMVSGTAATATGLALECSDGRLIASWPIADLVDLTPVSIGTLVSTMGKIGTGAGLTKGCLASTALMLSNIGTNLTTTTHVYVNVPYTVQ